MNACVKLVVRALYRYPVKSCGAEAVDRLTFSDDGLVLGDREWIVVDEQSNAVWLGSHPRLAVVRPRLQAQALSLANDLGDRVDVPLQQHADAIGFRVWNEAARCHELHHGCDAGDHAARFLQKTAGPGLRLVRMGQAALQRTGLNPIHMVAQASHAEFLAALPSGLAATGQIQRFRPNVLVGGLDEPLVPFIEDQFTRLEWSSPTGAGRLDVTGPCVRCVAPNVDPDSGAVDDSILHAVGQLSAQRRPGQPICFGVYARPPAKGLLPRDAIMSATIGF